MYCTREMCNHLNESETLDSIKIHAKELADNIIKNVKTKPYIIAIEGVDGSGKETQTKLLENYLSEAGLRVKRFSFPNYESSSSTFIKEYLNGGYGNIDDLTAYQISAIFSQDRLITYIKDIKPLIDSKDIDVIIFDRYIGSNLIYQGTKFLMKDEDEAIKKLEFESFIKSQYRIETYNLGLPKPNITIYLSLTPTASHWLRKGRLNKSNESEEQDIYESNRKYLEKCAESGLLVGNYFGWRILDCNTSRIKRNFGVYIEKPESISLSIFNILIDDIYNYYKGE